MPPLKRATQETDLYNDNVVSSKKQVPVEKHDSLFLGPLGELFSSKPHNDTFVENRYTKIQSIPADNPLLQTFTFSYRGTSFGLIKTNDATLEPDLKLVDTATANNDAYANNFNVGIIPFPLRTMWKSKEILVNDQLVNNLTNNDHLIAWVRHLITEIKKNWFDSKLIHIGEHDTAGHFDNVTYIGTADSESSAAANAGNPKTVNWGLRNRARLFLAAGSAIRVIDTLDTVCFNENGTDKYFPSDFDLRVILHRNPTNKYIRGYTGATAAAGVNTADVAITNFYLKLPMYKPKDQLAAATNRTMETNEKECIFYTMHYRLVTRTVGATAGRIEEQVIFTGYRPTRVFFSLYSQTRWNGGFGSGPVGGDWAHDNANIGRFNAPPPTISPVVSSNAHV